MRDIVKASRRTRRFARATEGGFPRLSGGVAHGLRCCTPPRHALLAERLGKPSLWVIINAPWYNANYRGVPGAGSSLFGDQRADPGLDLPGDRTGRATRNGYPPYPRRLFPPYDFAAPHPVRAAFFPRVRAGAIFGAVP